MNYTEMEAKVREATNNEPWGASSTLMQEIADGTNSYSDFHEIMPMIYKRFTEKSADEWRQIYKALQLLEFLVKHGSERVVDYARSHVAVIEMLKHFHYHDQNGRDQGINIRNRAKELTLLLGDVERIRNERKKARSSKVKYGGIGNDGSGGGFGGTGKKYGGFGSDSLQFGSGGYNSQVFGDGGGFNGSNYDGPGYSRHDDDEFEEYEVDGVGASTSPPPPSSSSRVAPAKEPVADFISFDDEPSTSLAQPVSAQPTSANDDDEFDDFQSAAPTSAPTSTGPSSSNLTSNLADLFSAPSTNTTNSSTISPISTQKLNAPLPTLPSQLQQQQPLVSQQQPIGNSNTLSSNGSSTKGTNESKGNDAFGSLWTSTKQKKQGQSGNLASLAHQNAKESMWGGSNASNNNTTSTPSFSSDSLI